MFIRLGVSALAILCLTAIFALVAGKAKSEGSILYEDLTCEELVYSYDFNLNVLKDMIKYWEGCVTYSQETVPPVPHSELACEWIKTHGMYVQGIVNDLAAVYNIKCVSHNYGTTE